MKKLLLIILLALASMNSYAVSIVKNANTFVFYTHGSATEMNEALGYLEGYIDAISTNKSINKNRLSQTSFLTIIRTMEKLIENRPSLGDLPTRIVVNVALASLEILEIKK